MLMIIFCVVGIFLVIYLSACDYMADAMAFLLNTTEITVRNCLFVI